MVKKRKGNSSLQKKKAIIPALSGNSDDDGGDKLYDDIDYLELNEEQQLLSKMGYKPTTKKPRRPAAEIEELYAISGSSEDDLPTVKQKNKKKTTKEQPHSGSDLDYGKYDEDDEGEAIGAWGGKRQHFYGGNPNDKHAKMKGKGTQQDDVDELSEAEMEEAEAKLIQAKQLTEMDESDFMDTFTTTNSIDSTKSGLKDSYDAKSDIGVKNVVQLDLSKLSLKERVQLFHRESPEFSGIVADFNSKFNELVTTLHPISKLISSGKLPSQGPAADYIRTKHQVILNYCTNIAAYLMFKTRRTSMKLHPITSRLVQYKQLLNQIEPVDKIMKSQIDKILPAINRNSKEKSDKLKLKRLDKHIKRAKEEIKRENCIKLDRHQAGDKNQLNKPKQLKKLKILEPGEHKESDQQLTTDERIAVDLYNATRTRKNNDNHNISEDEADGDFVRDAELAKGSTPSDITETKSGDIQEDEDDRRGITYQMFKNQGLAPKRKKDQRNPRVKHRHKFEKAKIRRKGQVRTLRTESKRYAGEVSGINMRVKKGVKLM